MYNCMCTAYKHVFHLTLQAFGTLFSHLSIYPTLLGDGLDVQLWGVGGNPVYCVFWGSLNTLEVNLMCPRNLYVVLWPSTAVE